MAFEEGLSEDAGQLFARASELFAEAGRLHAAARATSWLAMVEIVVAGTVPTR